MMKTFKLSIFAKIIYRYAHIPVLVVLLFYIIISLIGLKEDLNNLFPILINIILFYLVNKFYLKSYKLYPLEIDIDNEKIVFKKFRIKGDSLTVRMSDIKDVEGSVFSKKISAPLLITDSKTNITVGIPQQMKGFNEILKIILSNVDEPLYESLLKKMSESRGIDFENKKKRKN